MELLQGSIKKHYFSYLLAAFGSALISCIYGMVDMAMVGQYQGPQGTAALAVVAPVWNVIYSLGLLTGIGGSVIFSAIRGGAQGGKGENEYFTAAVIGSALFAALAWGALLAFEAPLLTFFGADAELLTIAQRYMQPIRWVFPLFLINQMLSAFLRNDGNPGLATLGVLSGGVFNMFGDYFFVFPCDMGVYGAGLATAIGCVISFIVLTVLFNRQIMRYLDADALAIYGPIINVSTFVQCCAYSVGQAAQPIISIHYGAGKGARIRQTLRLALGTTACFALIWTALSMICPNLYIRIFMSPTDAILRRAPAIIRAYAVSFLLLPFNIFSTYYFQAIMRPREAFIVSVARGLIISGALILLLPAAAGAGALWYAMPMTELLTALYAGWAMRRDTKALPMN